MKIKLLESLDVGMSGIEIEGDVTFTKDPKNWKGTDKNNRKYDFWSQFIVLEDDTGSVGCNITVKEGEAIEIDGNVKVKGKLEEYTDNEGNVQKKINGRVVKNKEEKKEETTNNVREDKNLHIIREVAIKAAVELIAAKEVKYEELFPCAEMIVKYITGEFHKKATETKVKEEGTADTEESVKEAIVNKLTKQTEETPPF